jgi:hypothetical protein
MPNARKTLETMQITGVLAERRRPDGKRQIKIKAAERRALLKQQKAERAAALFLDLSTDRSWAQIATEMGLSAEQLRDLTKTNEFDIAYNALFADLGHDPRFKASKAAIADLLPMAVRRMQDMMTATTTPAAVRYKIIQDVLKLNGMAEPQPQQSDRQELAAFLVANKIDITQMNMAIPKEYLDALGKLNTPEVIDAEVKEVPEFIEPPLTGVRLLNAMKDLTNDVIPEDKPEEIEQPLPVHAE